MIYFYNFLRLFGTIKSYEKIIYKTTENTSLKYIGLSS